VVGEAGADPGLVLVGALMRAQLELMLAEED